jgi:acetyl esterase/lipase
MGAHEGGNPIVETDYVIGANDSSPVLWRTWLNNIPPTSPDINPLFRPIKEIGGLNPQLIIVGGGEFARQEGQAWAALCTKAGVKCQFMCTWGQLHNFALGSSWVNPHVRRATDEAIVGWMRRCSMRNEHGSMVKEMA